MEQAGAAAPAGAGVGESGARRGGEPWIGGVLLVSAVASGVGGRAMLAAGGAVVATSVRVGSRPVVNLEFEIRVVQQSKKKLITTMT